MSTPRQPRFVLFALATTLLCGATLSQSQEKKPIQDKMPNKTLQGSQERTITGTLLDAKCGKPSGCPVTSATKEFGLVLPGNRFVKFDEGGNAKSLDALKAHKKSANKLSKGKTLKPKVKASGTLTGDTFNVESVRL